MPRPARRFPSPSLNCPAARLPVHNGGLAFDGRSGHQWIQAVRAYLDFRAGKGWRPATHRFHPESESYVAALRVLLSAWHGNTWRGIPVGRSRLRATLAALQKPQQTLPTATRRAAA